MNILEHYITEIHGVRDLKPSKWDSEPWVEVDLTTNCHERLQRSGWVLSASAWKRAQKKGYVMG